MPLRTPDAPISEGYFYRRVRIPKDPAFLQAVGGALSALMYKTSWIEGGSMTPEDAAALMKEMYLDWQRSNVNMIGHIFPYITAEVPDGALPCDGSFILIDDYPEYRPLYEVLADEFKIPDFAILIPNLNGRMLIGATPTGTDPTVAFPLGTEGGEIRHQLTTDELPAHAHTTDPHSHTTQPHDHTIPYDDIGHPSNTVDPEYTLAGPLPLFTTTTSSAVVTVNDETVTVNETGSNAHHNNMPPYTAVKFAIWWR